MLNSLIDLSVRNRLLIVLGLGAFLIAAIFMIPRLNLDAFPDVTNVQVSVNTEAPGLAALEVEQLITFPIESVMYALPDVAEVRSISKTGLSIVTVVFEEGTDIYFARQLIGERLQAARELIPGGIGVPDIGPNTSGLGQVYQYLLKADPDSGVDITELRSLNDWVVQLLLMPIDGVTEVLSFGGEVRQYQVNLDPNKLLAFNLSIEEIEGTIEANNRIAGGWYMDRGQEQLVIRGTGWLASGEAGLRNIADMPIKTIDGVVIKIGDVAQVGFGGEIRQGAVSLTERDESGNIQQLGEVVTGIVLKRLGANTKATIDGIQERLPIIQGALPSGVTIESLYDQADLITKAVDTVVEALLLAFVFIIVILALFLMNLRATVLVLLSIPLSIGLALIVMSMMELSANLMSLGGLAVAIGMLVDGSVVMVENIFKHLTQSNGDSKGGYELRVQEAGREVARPVFFAALIILVVFTPMFTFEGVEGKLFQPMAISIMVAVFAAVVVALLVVPALATFMFQRGVSVKESPVLRPIERGYQRLLQWVLGRRSVVITSAAALFIGAMASTPFIGTEFVPELEEGTINIRVTLAPSSSLETALTLAPKLEKILVDNFPEVTYTLSRIGRAEIGGDPEPVSNVEIYVGLKPVSDWETASDRYELQRKMQDQLSVHPGLLFNFSQPIATRVDELLSGVRAQLAIKLFGPDLDTLVMKGREIERVVKGVQGTRGVALEQVSGEAQLVVSPNREKLSRYGLAVGDVMSLVEKGLGGTAVGQVINGNERYDIYVRIDEVYRNNERTIGDLRLTAPTGAILRLADVAKVEIKDGPAQIRRDDVQRRIVIQSNVEGRDMGSVVADINTAISEQIELPTGYSVTIGGQFESQQRAQGRLALVVPVSVLLIALLLYFAFGSIGQALLILVNVPLALVGGIFALLLSGQYLSVPSSVGFITLFGVAVLNGVVLVESINGLAKGGVAMGEAVFRGTVSRLRPVLMTALTSALGLIPMLLSDGVGAEIQRPLATVIVGGLFSATALTLLVLPCLYPVFSKRILAAD
ncbi:efflux RND transporter permease subunit [Kordiimonas lipolytica]|uniref:Efflux RND transporter permease subunit n=1 Tax=Kordiimonas lipolytica TaxID=1662421 RepID=A0ABV8UF97_9PROT|nr:CusA/CzcA family heavy metal efflux RND transporter [Kordiimonas lipolytica]